MITPGTSKFERLHQNREELLGAFDTAIKEHRSFLFLGYGFNDSQLTQGTLEAKLKNQKSPGLVITRDSNNRIERLLTKCDNLWLICKHPDNRNQSTRIYNKQYQDWLYLEDQKIWQIEHFTREILGA